jgi:hypothetical protein
MPNSIKTAIVLLYVNVALWLAVLLYSLEDGISSSIVSNVISMLLFVWVANIVRRNGNKAFANAVLLTSLLPLFWLWKAYDRYFFDMSIFEAFNDYPVLWVYIFPLLCPLVLLLPSSRAYFSEKAESERLPANDV